MPIYFAYGSNMDVEAMRLRCPASVPLGPARLMGHRFLVMRDGWASIRPQRAAVVHGLIWRLARADIPALDLYEDLDAGLYRKVIHPVLRTTGAVRALVYVGHTTAEGVPHPGYMESILASARALAFPEPYLESLASLCPDEAPSPGEGSAHA